jgi:predicted metalloprotease
MSGSDIDNAVIARLNADATLLGYCPNGVYWNLAPPGATAFVVVSLVDAHDEAEFGGTAYEEALYAIEARILALEGQTTPIKDAADRIHALLQDQPLTVAGYDYGTMHRDTEGAARIRMTEFDAADPGVRWYRRGGYYRVMMAPHATGRRAHRVTT